MTAVAYKFVEMYAHALDGAANVLTKGAAFAASKGVSEAEMLDWRLIEDMQPLSFQLKVVCDFATQWPARVAALPPPAEVAGDLDAQGFKAAIAEATAYLGKLTAEQFAGRDDVELTYTIGTGMTLSRPNIQWLAIFATTNLYFHLSTAYDILRSKGAQLGKADLFAGGL